MNVASLTLATAAILVIPAVFSAEHFVLVGEIPVACPIRVRLAQGFMPNPNLKLSPVQAATVAEAAQVGVRCNSKLLQTIYADSRSYYIIKLSTDPKTAPYVAAVNAQTGAVSVTVRK